VLRARYSPGTAYRYTALIHDHSYSLTCPPHCISATRTCRLHHGLSQVSQTDDDDCYANDGGQDNGGMDEDDLNGDDLSQEDADEDADDVDELDEEKACTEAPSPAPARMGPRESSKASWTSKAGAPAPPPAPTPPHSHFDDILIEACGDTDAAPSADVVCIQRDKGGIHVTTAVPHELSLHHNAISKQNPACASWPACAPSASVESEPCVEPAHATAHHEPAHECDERVPGTADAVGSGSKDERAQELAPLTPAPVAPPSANDGARPRAGGVDCSPKSTPDNGGGLGGRSDAGRGAGCASLRRLQSTVPTYRCSCTSLHGEAL